MRASTRFVVGSQNRDVLALNEAVLPGLGGEWDLTVIEGAGHLFGGPGQIEEVARLAGEWFEAHLG